MAVTIKDDGFIGKFQVRALPHYHVIEYYYHDVEADSRAVLPSKEIGYSMVGQTNYDTYH